MSDIAFANNYTNLFFLNVAPPGAPKDYARIGAGINKVDWNGNEVVSQDDYYDGDGMSETEVTGGQLVGTFSGHRRYGDRAQDWIARNTINYGESRKTDLLWIAPDGQRLEGKATVANIKTQGGDPKAKSDFSFEAHYNGMPELTPGDASSFPDGISAEAVSVEVGATAPIKVAATPEGASGVCVYGVDDPSVATVDADGVVTGVAPGETEVSVKSAAKPSIRTTVRVTVSEAAA